MPDPALWYFAYGSNMSEAIFLGRRRMQPLATRRARLEDHRLCFDLPVGPGERGVANLRRQVGSHVWGVLYLLGAEDFRRLDRTEGVHRGYYERTAVEVIADGNQRVAAFTYRSSASVDGRKPSARYLGLLLEGAKEHELPAEYVRALASLDLARDERVGEPAPPPDRRSL